MEVTLEQVLLVITTRTEVKIQDNDHVLFVGHANIALEELTPDTLNETVMAMKPIKRNTILIRI